MENKERKEKGLTIDKDAQIQVLVNSTSDEDGDDIDLGRVFHSMKLRFRLYAWVLLLCMTVGLFAPLVLYQFTREPLKVSSVVTLKYDVPDPSLTTEALQALQSDAELPMVPVNDLTAPCWGMVIREDGTRTIEREELDLTQITSSFVLQNAMDGMALSQPIQLDALRKNVVVERILSEDSRRQQEVASSMVEEKSVNAYQQVQDLQLRYENTFIVSLSNGFSSGDDDRNKVELKGFELRQLLDRILCAYNDYLVETYPYLKLPDDEISVIDTESYDIPESTEQLRLAVQRLHDYCDKMPAAVKEYRSWQTGRSLTDWMETLETVQEVNVDYLYTFVYTNNVVLDKKAIITSYNFQIRDTQSRLDEVNDNIATVQSILDTYKNDEIYVSMEESDASKSTKTTTDYYNELILQQTKNYEEAMTLEAKIVDLQNKIDSIGTTTNLEELSADQEKIKEAREDLANSIDTCSTVYASIRAHMEELIAHPLFTTYAAHSAALGKEKNFLQASSKNMLIGLVGGLAIGCFLWFMNSLIPEFSRRHEDKEKAGTNSGSETQGKEADGQ